MWQKVNTKNKKNRTINTIINFFVGILDKFCTLLLSFITRTIFIKKLGANYLGLNGLFTNILSILSLAELGIESAIIYRLYKPIKDNDEEKIASLITYYKRMYSIVAGVVLILGLAIIPFLHIFVNVEQDIGNIYAYYLMFLLNSVLSYLYIYKTSIIKADQKEYKLKLINLILTIIQFVLQVISLVVFNNYYYFLIIKISVSIINNIVCSKRAEKDYPYIKNKKELNKEDKKGIWKNIKDMFCYQIGGVILNNTDNILMSTLVGTIWVGIYSNYDMIFTAITGFTSMFFTSAQASVGNLGTEENQEKNLKVFKTLTFLSFWIYGFCSICFGVLIQDFIKLWVGEEYLLNMSVVIICILNYYIKGMLYPVWNFRFTIGLFEHTKYVMIAASLINIVLSIILGMKFGILGIFVATAISRIVTNVWYEPYKLYKVFFKKKIFKYYIGQVTDFIVLVIAFICTYYISTKIIINNAYINFAIKCILCVIIPNIIFYIYKYRTEELEFIKVKIKEIMKRGK